LDDHLSNTVISFFLPEEKGIEQFKIAIENAGHILYPGKGKYTDLGMFQIANMGEIYENDCRVFLDVLEEVLTK